MGGFQPKPLLRLIRMVEMDCWFCFHLHFLASPLVLQSQPGLPVPDSDFRLLSFCIDPPVSPLRKSTMPLDMLTCYPYFPGPAIHPTRLLPKLTTLFCHSCSCCSLANIFLVYLDIHLFWRFPFSSLSSVSAPSLDLSPPLLATLHSLRRPSYKFLPRYEKGLVFLS